MSCHRHHLPACFPSLARVWSTTNRAAFHHPADAGEFNTFTSASGIAVDATMSDEVPGDRAEIPVGPSSAAGIVVAVGERPVRASSRP